MVKYRQLDTNERRLTINNIAVLKEQIEEMNYNMRLIEFDITQGLELKARATKRIQKENLKQLAQGMKEIEFAISNAEKQLKEGVPIKEEPKEVK